MSVADQLDRVLGLDSHHPCYRQWRQYHLDDIKRGTAIARLLQQNFTLKDMAVLDVGSGLGGVAIALANFGAHVTGVEMQSEQVRFATSRAAELGTAVEFRVGSGEMLPFADELFDMVVMNDVIEHFTDPIRVINEVARVLKGGGQLYVLAPNRNSLSVTFCDPHYRLPFVVWMRQSLRDHVVRLLRRGSRYDGNWFPSMTELIQAFACVGISLRCVGFFQYGTVKLAKPTRLRRVYSGYPVYLGLKR